MWQSELVPPHHRNRLLVDGTVLVLFLVFGGCSAEYQAGDCIQNPKDGYIWRITAVEFGKYTAQGWVNGKWGLTVSMDLDVPRERLERFERLEPRKARYYVREARNSSMARLNSSGLSAIGK
jgi:hypothetical protein